MSASVEGREPVHRSGLTVTALCGETVDRGAPLTDLPPCDECCTRSADLSAIERTYLYTRAVSDDWDATGRAHLVTYLAMHPTNTGETNR